MKKSDNVVMNVTKVFQKMKTKACSVQNKILLNEKKGSIIIIKKYFNLENLIFFIRKSIKNFFRLRL